MKKRLLILLLPALFLISGPVAAHDETERTSNVAATKAEDKDSQAREAAIKAKIEEYTRERKLATLQNLCDLMVTHRQKSLERMREKINASQKLDAEQKESLLAQITGKLNELAGLDSTCTTKSDVAALRNQVRSLEQKHLFRSVLPRLHATRATNKASAFVGRLEKHTAVLQKKIDEAEARGCDVTDEKAALAAYTAAVQDAQTHLSKAKEIIATFKDTADPGSAKREQVKAEMTAMKNALLEARDAHKEIRAGLKMCPKPTQETSP